MPSASLDDQDHDMPIFGVMIALVARTDADPDNLNRVLLTFPTLAIESTWARVASGFAGPNKGAFFFPAKGDEVLVLFEGGNAERPYVIGVLWNGVDTPPVPSDKIAMIGELRTASGARLQFDDSEGAAKIIVTDASGNAVTIDSANNRIIVAAKQDLVLQAPGAISISGGRVTINATETLALSSDGSGALSGKSGLQFSGSTIALN